MRLMEDEHVWVYILRCADGSFYVGSTKQQTPEGRTWQHNEGVVPGYTHSRRGR